MWTSCSFHMDFTFNVCVEIMEISLDLCKTKFALLSNMVKNNISVGFFLQSFTPSKLWWSVLGILSHGCSGNSLGFLWNGFPVWKWILHIQSALISTRGWFLWMHLHGNIIISWKSAFSEASLSTNPVISCPWECSAAFVPFVNTFLSPVVAKIMKY